jgi:pyrroloquinoline quinone biosynthesis protein E
MKIPRPYSLLAELTYRCPLSCPYCSNAPGVKLEADLDTPSWLRVLEQAGALGIVQVHFSGGEPLVRTDLAQLVAGARRATLYTNLITSGMGLDEARLESLRSGGLDAIQISLQDTLEAENDRIAGARSFSQKLRALELTKSFGFPLTLNVVLHRHNLDRIEEIIELAANIGANRLELAHVQYTGWAFRNRRALLPSVEQLERANGAVLAARERLGRKLEILHVLPDYFQAFPKACLNGWGRMFITVAPDGAALPCQSAREIASLTFPNVRDHSLEEIWFNDPAFQRFRGTDWLPEPCRGCDRREVDYGGCRCQAFLLTGEASATDPVCQLAPTHQIVEEALIEQPVEGLEYRRYAR